MKSLATVISLGCAKNLVDSEVMVSHLASHGYAMTSDPSQASLVLVNTCGFLESAVQEAIETILDLARYKVNGCCKRLVVAGCMVQRYGKKLLNLMPEVDCFLGASHFYALKNILEALEKGVSRRLWITAPRFLFQSELPRSRSTPFFTAYLKIAEGCSNRCTYCLIPRLRGPYRSRSVEDVLAEARRLAGEGVKEVNLIAQDTTAFGADRADPHALVRLLERLDTVDGIAWIRLLYSYPDRVDTVLLETIGQSGKIVPYLDIPLQHSVPRILKAMGRATPYRDPHELIEIMRRHVPEIALRTSLIVGFPGETEADFQALLAFVEHAQFDYLGVFEFSPERGTHAAKLPYQTDPETKAERCSALLERQRSISRQRLTLRIGQIAPVLIEGFHPETELLLTGRLATQAPEVDGNVIITKGQADVGDLVAARITAAHDYDLEAEICDASKTLNDEDIPGRACGRATGGHRKWVDTAKDFDM
jgi:ribosomal protein S12 methylthiotransferase